MSSNAMLRALAAVGLLVTAATASCGLTLGYGDYQDANAGAGGSGMMSIPCQDVAACPAGDECRAPACVNNVCAFEFTPAGHVLTLQTLGDCHTQVCGDHGDVVNQVDDTDVYKDGQECTNDVCSQGVASNPPSPDGAKCGNNLQCKGGKCTGCKEAVDCGTGDMCFGWACANQDCVQKPAADGTACGAPASCTNGMLLENTCMAGMCSAKQSLCAPYGCALDGTSCRTNCGVDSDCSTGNYCNAPSCLPIKGQGMPCVGSNECTSGFCNDSICCQTDCSYAAVGPCHRCAPGGICSLSADGTLCGTAACAANVLVNPSCVGGGCNGTTNTSCAPGVCSGTSCSSTCGGDMDCASGSKCVNSACCGSCKQVALGEVPTQLVCASLQAHVDLLTNCICAAGPCQAKCSSACAGGLLDAACITCAQGNCAMPYTDCSNN